MPAASASREIRPPLTAERLRELIRYEPETGEFFWSISRGAGVREPSQAPSH
jgi:hypothetical protein